MTIFWPRGIHSRWRLELCIIRLHSKWMISRDYPYAAAWFCIDSLCYTICTAVKELGLSSWNKIDSHKLVGHFQSPKSLLHLLLTAPVRITQMLLLFLLCSCNITLSNWNLHRLRLKINVLFAVILDYNRLCT